VRVRPPFDNEIEEMFTDEMMENYDQAVQITNAGKGLVLTTNDSEREFNFDKVFNE
jgi:hypothetical protein